MTGTEQKYQTKFTQEELSKWTQRLRDPNSKQAVGSGCAIDGKSALDMHSGTYETKGDEEMCCLVHGQHALEGRALLGVCDNDYWAWVKKSGFDDASGLMASMNDSGSYSLPQIADWIDEHLLPADIL